MESLTKEDAYDLANFVAVLFDRYPRLLYELDDDKCNVEEEQEDT